MSFERHTRRKIKNHPSEVDTDALWNSIKNDIPQERDKKKRGIIFFIIFGSLVIGGISALSIDSKNDENHTLLERATSSISSSVSQTNIITPFSKMEESNLRNELNKIKSDNNSIFLNLTKQISPQSNHDHSVKESSRPNHEGIIFANSNSEKNQSIYIPLDKKVNVASEKTITPVIVMNSKEEDKLLYLDPIDSKKGLVEIMEEDEELIAKVEEKIEDTEENKSEEENQKKLKFSFGMTTAVSFSNARINSKSTSYFFYERKREISEKSHSTFSLSNDFIIHFKKNLSFRTGLSYTQLGETLTYWNNEINLRNSNTPDNSGHDYSGDGDIITSLTMETTPAANVEPTPLSVKIEREKITYTNKHHFIDIPCVIGYNIGEKKVSLLLESGIYINLISNFNGHIAVSEGGYREIKKEDNYFKSNILFTTYTGASLNFKLSNNTNMKLGAHHQYTPLSITTQDNLLKQKYHLVGFHLGMSRSF